MIELVGGKLYQWETGRMLLVEADVDSEANAIQFANQGDTVALEIEHDFTRADGEPKIRIPDKCLQSGKNLLVYLVKTVSNEESDDHSSRILETKIFSVAAKPRPKTYIPIAAEEALGVVRRLTAAAQEAAKEAEGARIKAEAEKLYAIDAAEAAENARDASISAKNYAEAAREDAEYARDNAIAAKIDAETSANTAETESRNAEIKAGQAEEYANLANSDSIIASNAAKKAEDARLASQSFAQEAKDAETNAQTQAKAAETFASVARDEATNAAKYADNSYEFASNAEDAKNTAVSAANTAAKKAAEETIRQIEDAVGGSINKIAKIDDNVVGSDAWSSKNIVDRLCPTFKEDGKVVQCEPVKGYPLTISSKQAATVTLCGKNLYNFHNDENLNVGYVFMNSGKLISSSDDYRYTDPIPVGHLIGEKITLNKLPGGTNPGTSFYKADDTALKYGYGKGAALEVPAEAAYMRVTVNYADVKAGEIQLEIGSKATTYEPYAGNTLSLSLSLENEYTGTLDSMDGINTLYAYSDDNAVDITVTGKANPAAIIDKLTKAVISLGGNI